MKSWLTVVAATACALTLTACGGGGDDNSGNALSRADEGIWVSIDGELQSIILSDGTYWGVYSGPIDTAPALSSAVTVQHGKANISGSNVSGTYTESSIGGFTNCPAEGCTILPYSVNSGSYSGSVSAQNTLKFIFDDSGIVSHIPGSSNDASNFTLSYDGIYARPASLSAIAGSYSVPGNTAVTVTISGSNLAMTDQFEGGCTMNGTITPHGNVGVFDVSFSFNTPPAGASCSLGGLVSGPATGQPAGTYLPFTGILFQTTIGGKNVIEIAAANNAPSNPNYFYFWGSKQ
jgi:hypothetical protein